MANKKGFPKDSVCKPCWELKYCPYGYMVEWSPGLSSDGVVNLKQIEDHYQDTLHEFYSGSFQTEKEVWDAVDRLHYLLPSAWAHLSQFDPNEISCEIFGHTCPVFH